MRRKRPTALAGVLLLAAFSLGGCARREKDPAVVAYERFIGAVRMANAAALWERVTPASRTYLAEKLHLAPDATTEQVSAALGVRPGWQFELDLPQQARLAKEAPSDDRRVVVGPLAGRTWRVVVRKVDAVWLVDLLESQPVEG